MCWVCHNSVSKFLLSRRSFLGGAAATAVAGRYYIGQAHSAEPVRIAFPTSDHYAPVFVAKEAGFFEKAGLSVEFKPFTTGVPVIEGLVSGNIDVGFIATPGMISVARNFPLTAAMGVALEGSGLVVKKGGIKKIEELADRRVALPARGSIAHMLLLRALINAKVDPSRVRIIEIGDPQGLRLSLERGEVDAVSAWEPWVSQFEQSPDLQRLAGSHDIWPNHQCDLMWVNNSFLKQKPDTVKAVMDSVLRGMRSIHKNVTASASAVSTSLKAPVEIIESSMKRQQYTHVLQKQNIEDQYKFLTELNIVKKDSIPTWDRLIDADLYSFAQKRWSEVAKT